MVSSDEYAEALRELDRQRAEGLVDDARWEVVRAKLVAEASSGRRPWTPVRVLGVVLLVVGVLFVLGIVVRLLGG